MRYRIFTFLLLCFLACATALAQEPKQPVVRKSAGDKQQLPGKSQSLNTIKEQSSNNTENKNKTHSGHSEVPPAIAKDSAGKPERVDSYVFNDDIARDRIFLYQVDRYFNMPVMGRVDTLIGDRFKDIIYRKDVGATFLGVSGSAAVTYIFYGKHMIICIPLHHSRLILPLPTIFYSITPAHLSPASPTAEIRLPTGSLKSRTSKRCTRRISPPNGMWEPCTGITAEEG